MSRTHPRPYARGLFVAICCLAASAFAESPQAKAEGKAAASLEEVATFQNVPVGVAISKEGRVFLAFSRAIDDKEPFSVAELKNGKPELFPPGFKQDAGTPAPDRLLSVQALTVDARNRLWILDTAKVGTNPIQPGAPKLIVWDLAKGRVVKTITFPAEVAGPTAFLNDVRVDLGRGREGVAFLTDASGEGPNGLVVVDIASGKAVRRLNDHPSTKADPQLTLKVEGQPLIQKTGPDAGKPLRLGADGIALSADRRFVYYSPISSHRLYRVDANALADLSRSDEDVKKTVQDVGDKGFAADGLLEDSQGGIFATDIENNAIHRLTPQGKWELIIQSPQLDWPDTLALQPDGTLVFTVTQINRSERTQGRDMRQKPFVLYQVKTDSQPLFLDTGTRRQARDTQRR